MNLDRAAQSRLTFCLVRRDSPNSSKGAGGVVAVRHPERRPAVFFDHAHETEDLATQLSHRGELVALESDSVPGDAFDGAGSESPDADATAPWHADSELMIGRC